MTLKPEVGPTWGTGRGWASCCLDGKQHQRGGGGALRAPVPGFIVWWLPLTHEACAHSGEPNLLPVARPGATISAPGGAMPVLHATFPLETISKRDLSKRE